MLKSFISSLFQDPEILKIYFQKIGAKFVPRNIANKKYLEWLSRHAIEIGDFCRDLDPDLWLKSQDYADQLDERAVNEIAPGILSSMGGGGASALLFFLGVKLKPKYIFETGVSLGYSSATLLASANESTEGGEARLFSSDFPYPGLPDSHRNIGLLVPERYKRLWRLETRGDSLNIPALLNEMPRVDLAHYDSDKSYAGREFFFSQVQAKIHGKSVVIFDDIHENQHFLDLVTKLEADEFCVFRFKSKFIGMLGKVS